MQNLDKDGLSYFWSKIKDYIETQPSLPGTITSPNQTSKYTETVTREAFDNLVKTSTLVPNTIYNIEETSNSQVTTDVAIGSGMIWYGEYNKIPANYMEAVGQELNKNDYPELFDVIGYIYSDHTEGDLFNLPNMRKDGVGRVPVQLDSKIFNTLGKTYGESEHTLSIEEMPKHSHNVSYSSSGAGGWKNQFAPGDNYDVSVATSIHHSGSDEAHNNIQPCFTVFFIIKVKPEAYSEDLRNLDNQIAEIQQNNNLLQKSYIRVGIEEQVINKESTYSGVLLNWNRPIFSKGDFSVVDTQVQYTGDKPVVVSVSINIAGNVPASSYLLSGSVNNRYATISGFSLTNLANYCASTTSLITMNKGDYITALIGNAASFTDIRIYRNSTLSANVIDFLDEEV